MPVTWLSASEHLVTAASDEPRVKAGYQRMNEAWRVCP